jgi:hypothetical protein
VKRVLASINALRQWEDIRKQFEESREFLSLPEHLQEVILEKERIKFFREDLDETGEDE